MKKRILVFGALAVSLAFGMSACEGDDVTEGPGDAGNEASTGDGSTIADASTDGGTEASAAHPPWALFTVNYSDQSDVVALSTTTGKVDGVFNYASKYGATSVSSDGPWVLEQSTDLVQKLDPSAPWNGGSTWNVLGTDDGGLPNANPYKVIAGPAGKDYVLRFNRNQIAVIDGTQAGTKLSPTKFVDLSAYLDATDEDGAVDMLSGAYVPSQHRVYVLLANIDLYNIDPQAYFVLCGTTHSEIVAIDTDTDTLVSAADGGASAAPIVLGGYDAFGLVYDTPRSRLLVINDGCSDPSATDGGPPGAHHMREIDAVDLATGTPSMLLDLSSGDAPNAFAMADATHMALRLESYDYTSGVVKLWDVTTSGLGADVPGAPDLFASDGQGNLFGVTTEYLADGGVSTTMRSVRVDDGGVTSFGSPPFKKLPAVVTNVDFWSP